MAETGGDGFQIAKGYVSVEARVNEASVTRARQQIAGTAPAQTQAQQPQQQAQQPTATQTLGDRLADARASLASTGTEAARTLEQGFRQGLSSLSNMAVQQLRSLSNVPGATGTRPTATIPKVQTNVSTAQQLQQQSAAIVTALSRSLGPQIAAQVGNLIRMQVAQQRAATPPPVMQAQSPLVPQMPQTATRGMRGGGAGGQVVNNYTTNVRIEPKFVRQLLDVIRDLNQLKSRNRATR